MQHDATGGDLLVANETLEAGPEQGGLGVVERPTVEVERRAPQANLPHVLPQRDRFIGGLRRGREQPAGTDPKHAMALAGELHGDLLRTLKAELEIENRQHDHVILAIGARGRAQDGGGGRKHLVGQEVEQVGKAQLEIIQGRGGRVELPARHYCISLPESEHQPPGSLSAVDRELLFELRLVLFQTIRGPAAERFGRSKLSLGGVGALALEVEELKQGLRLAALFHLSRAH